MALAVHNSGELGKIIAGVIAFAVFVVVALTWVPAWVGDTGGTGAPEVGRTVRMVQ